MKTLAEKCRDKCVRDGLRVAISDTKWRELCWALARMQVATAWRTKDFLTGEISMWDREWYNHVALEYCAIQWLEIQSPPGSRDELRDLLQAIDVPFAEDGNFWVHGYCRC